MSAGKTAAEETYQTDLAAGRAKLAGQGIEVEGSPQWDDLKGGLIAIRDATIADLDQEMLDFRASGALEWFENDYEYLTRVRTTDLTGGKNGDPSFDQRIGNDDHGRSNREVFNPDQYALLKTNDDKQYEDLYNEYAAMLAPGIAAYEKYSFGTEADKAQYNADMDLRISQANTWYDREVQAAQIESYNAALVQSKKKDETFSSDLFKEKDGTIVKKEDSAEWQAQKDKVDFSDQRGK
jgi:hypothetical protein